MVLPCCYGGAIHLMAVEPSSWGHTGDSLAREVVGKILKLSAGQCAHIVP
jgi:hypothetical protein